MDARLKEGRDTGNQSRLPSEKRRERAAWVPGLMQGKDGGNESLNAFPLPEKLARVLSLARLQWGRDRSMEVVSSRSAWLSVGWLLGGCRVHACMHAWAVTIRSLPTIHSLYLSAAADSDRDSSRDSREDNRLFVFVFGGPVS
mmetsp:Transcript_28530/g.55879  ORF Transcript_28530/g.55879 Transcript_28530/m.55879 type:complete len:143 (+) Transcript_28530:1769-2197(+)